MSDSKNICNINRMFEEDTDFDLFRSQICHLLKSMTDERFVMEVLDNDLITFLWEKNRKTESLYVLAMIDYLKDNAIRLSDIDSERCHRYDDKRKYKLSEPLFPKDAVLMDKLVPESNIKERLLEECNKDVCARYFLKYNIIEKDIRDAC